MKHSIFLSNQQLRQCEQLKYLGLKQYSDTGSHLARGFADLGFEQFVVLPGEQLMSLFTGHKAAMDAEVTRNFFLVPAVDDLLTFLAERAVTIKQLGADADLTWHIELEMSRQIFKNQAQTLWQVLLDVCLQIGEQVNSVSLN